MESLVEKREKDLLLPLLLVITAYLESGSRCSFRARPWRTFLCYDSAFLFQEAIIYTLQP